MTMLEIAIAMTVLAIGLGSSVYSLTTATALERTTRERATALQAAESALESMQGVPFDEVFARFNASKLDDDPGAAPGEYPGSGFAVVGLTPWPKDPDGLPGEIIFPGDGVDLYENTVNAELGMPRDLTLDTPPFIQNTPIDPAKCKVLPVLVRVRWSGARGNSQVVIGTTLNNERKPE